MALNDPSGIDRDRAVIVALDAERVELAVGPSRTRVHLDAEELPDGAEVGTWVVMDLQSVPPMPLFIDRALSGPGGP